MGERLQKFGKVPWDGGLNTSLEPGLIDPNDLTIADGCISTISSSRTKRGGIVAWDYTHTVTHRASSGTSRTLTLSSVAGLSVGNVFTVLHTDSYNSYYDGTHKIAAINGSTVTYTATGSLTESTTAVSTIKFGLTSTSAVLGAYDFWREGAGTNTQYFMSVIGSTPSYYQYASTGLRSAISTGGSYTAVSNATKCAFETFTNRVVISFDGLGNTPKYWDGTNPIVDLSSLVAGGDQAPPDFSISRGYLGRLWTNDKSKPSRLHFSETGNLAKWNGSGDSGGLDIDPQDGDSEGITGIFPGFKGNLFVAKGRKFYRIVGDAPETFKVIPISSGIGCVNHNSIAAIDQDEVMYASGRGFHFLSASDTYGDFEGSFASLPIQSTFNSFDSARLKYCQAAYVSHQNLVAFAVSEEGQSTNNAIYVYSTTGKRWFRWPDIHASCLALRTEDKKRRLYIGTDNGRILQTESGTLYDFGALGIAVDAPITAGTRTTNPTKRAITLRLKSGSIYPDGNPSTVKAFKTLSMFYRPVGNYSFTARIRIDNYPAQSVNFLQTGSFDVLGSSFVLGTSYLGSQPVLLAYTYQIDGYGHGCTIEVEHSAADQDLEIYGYAFDWEPMGTQQETVIDP